MNRAESLYKCMLYTIINRLNFSKRMLRSQLQMRLITPGFQTVSRYKYLSDADKKNTFDVDSYLSSLRRKKRRVITEDEPFDLYDIELSDEDFAAE